MMKYLIGAGIGLLAAVPATAADKWIEAKSDHFIVYSEGTEADARTLATNLERLDGALRMIRGMSTVSKEVPDATKLTVYQFGATSDIGMLAGQRGVAGFFIPRAGRSVAFVPLKQDRDTGLGTRTDGRDIDPAKVLFHEYAHYFMYQHSAAAYPFWYSEGFAELFGTLQLTDNGFNLGEPPEHRVSTLKSSPVDVRKLFDPPKEGDYSLVQRQYAQGWLASSYLTFEPSRKGQLADYLRRLIAGEANLTAAEQAFGDLDKLQNELNAYMKGRVRAMGVTYSNFVPPKVAVREVTPGEAAQMRMHIRSSRGVTRGTARGMVGQARALAAQYPTSLPVLLAATEAEFDAENYPEAEDMAKRALAVDPQSEKAQLYVAGVHLERAKTDPAAFGAARAAYVAANNANPNHPEALAGYYRTFVLAGETPPEDALIALEKSFELAPFDSETRMTLAHRLLLENRDKEALILLAPITNDPHSGKRAERYRALVDKLKAGEREPLIAKLTPKNGAEDEKDDG